MGGGLMQLVAYGAQDIYLTGNPQITFFKVVYRRHTNFSMELIQQTLSGSAGVSATQTLTVSRNGDLIMDVWVSQSSTGSIDGEIYDYIDNVEVEIGGQLIDRQHGDWNAVWWNLTTPESKVDGLRNMFTGQSGATDVGATNGSYFYYPLNFWFCKNPGLALPLIALQYHEVKFKIKWGSSSLATSGTSPEVWINYVYLDTDERRRFAQVSHEYLIEQVQRDTFSGDKKSFDLKFNHPVKELIWVNDVSATRTGSSTSFGPIRSTVNCITSSDDNCYNNADATKMKLSLNGHDRFQSKEMKYFKTCQPMKYHTRIPSSGKRFSVVSYLDGAIGNGQSIYFCHKPVRVIKASISKIVAAGDGNSNYTLGLDDGVASGAVYDPDDGDPISAATGAVADGIRRFDFTLLNTEVVCVPAGKHITIEDTTGANTTVRGIVTLELEELPILIGGSNTDLANIYCYSFALKPEEHQPSGTCNFSRIDNAQMMFDDNIGNSSSSLKVFAINYNVLRIMSGMGGLAYSN
jgi:hypothetical protein